MGSYIDKNHEQDDIKAYCFEDVYADFKLFEGKLDCDLLDQINQTYNYEFIFNELISKHDVKKVLGTPIPSDQYSKLLTEFVKFGGLMHFPEKEVYKMFRKVIVKSLIIAKMSSMYGNLMYVPIQFYKDILIPYYSDFIGKNVILLDNGYGFSVDYSKNDFLKKFNINPDDLDNNLNEVIKKVRYFFGHNLDYLNTKNPLSWDKMGKPYKAILQDGKSCAKIFNLNVFDTFKRPYADISIIDDNNIKLLQSIDYIYFELDLAREMCGIVTELLGLSYIFYYLKQLRDDMTINEIIVWINKMIHIYHIRNDISIYFIEGGAKALNKIENGLKND